MKKNLIILFALLTVFSACSRKGNDVVKIGVIGSQTGSASTTSSYWTNGMKYAIDQLNAVENGEKYQLVIEDCQSDPAQAVACYKRLEQKGVKYVLAIGGQFAMAIAPLTKGKDVLFFTTADYNESILEHTDRGFRIYPTSRAFADSAVNYMYRNYGFTKYATFAFNSMACLEATKAFAKGVDRIGGQMVFQEIYDMGVADFSSLVTKHSDKGAQGVFMTGFGISPLAFANQLAASSNFDNIVLFGDLNLATESFVTGIKNKKAKIYYADCRFPQKMETEYLSKYRTHSNAIVTTSFIIPFLVKEARVNSSFSDINAQLNYMRGRTFRTEIGDIKIDKNGNGEMNLQVYQLQ